MFIVIICISYELNSYQPAWGDAMDLNSSHRTTCTHRFVRQAPFKNHGACIFAITIRFQSVASVSPLHTQSIGRSNHPQKVMWGPVLFEIFKKNEHQWAKWQNTYINGLCLCVSRQSVEQQSNTVESSLTTPPAHTP